MKQKKVITMVVIKKIKLNLIGNYLEDIVGLCSQIRVSQEELKYIESRMKDNKNDFSSGNISKSLYDGNKTDLEREKRKLTERLDLSIKKSLKKLENIKNILKAIEI